MTKQHGVYRTYSTGCRCDLCRAANAEHSRKRRRGEGPLRVLPATEFLIEKLARTVVCPNCGSAAGMRCRYGSLRNASVGLQNYSHTGRLNLARGVTA